MTDNGHISYEGLPFQGKDTTVTITKCFGLMFFRKGTYIMKIYPTIKRFFDLTAALLMLILLSPLLLGVAVLIKIIDKETVLFRQPRPGQNGKIFTIYKFKTMIQKNYTDDGRPLTDMERMTKLGKFLRGTSIDELPQLFNILKGDMSFIGPRPLLVRYLNHYTDFQARRHEVTPGISGWAQVNGRNQITWEERLSMDVWYVEHLSFRLDVKILFKTVSNIISGRGVNRAEDETMNFFDEEISQ